MFVFLVYYFHVFPTRADSYESRISIFFHVYTSTIGSPPEFFSIYVKFPSIFRFLHIHKIIVVLYWS